MNDRGELLLDEYEKLFSERTKLVSFAHVSNVLGTVNPAKEMIATAHTHSVPVLIDGAQSVPHMKVDVQDLDADFFAFSGHKIYGIVFPLRFCLFLSEGVHCPDSLIQNYHYWCICP